jgi:hypothetical protein
VVAAVGQRALDRQRNGKRVGLYWPEVEVVASKLLATFPHLRGGDEDYPLTPARNLPCTTE